MGKRRGRESRASAVQAVCAGANGLTYPSARGWQPVARLISRRQPVQLLLGVSTAGCVAIDGINWHPILTCVGRGITDRIVLHPHHTGGLDPAILRNDREGGGS